MRARLVIGHATVDNDSNTLKNQLVTKEVAMAVARLIVRTDRAAIHQQHVTL